MPEPQRVFGLPTRLGEVHAATLRRICPEVPTLEELVAEFGGRTNLMLELNRGVHWVFSNHGVKMQGLRNNMLALGGG